MKSFETTNDATNDNEIPETSTASPMAETPSAELEVDISDLRNVRPEIVFGKDCPEFCI